MTITDYLLFSGYFQPYCAWIGLVGMTVIVFTYGYSTFHGGFSISDFFSYYSESNPLHPSPPTFIHT